MAAGCNQTKSRQKRASVTFGTALSLWLSFVQRPQLFRVAIAGSRCSATSSFGSPYSVMVKDQNVDSETEGVESKTEVRECERSGRLVR